jgi:hypothetical protein
LAIGQVGLAGAGRADAEHDGVLVDRLDVALLVERLGPDGAAPVAQDVERQHVGRLAAVRLAQHRALRSTESAVSVSPLASSASSCSNSSTPEGVVGGLAGQRDLVAADVHVAGEHALHGAQDLVAAARAG